MQALYKKLEAEGKIGNIDPITGLPRPYQEYPKLITLPGGARKKVFTQNEELSAVAEASAPAVRSRSETEELAQSNAELRRQLAELSAKLAGVEGASPSEQAKALSGAKPSQPVLPKTVSVPNANAKPNATT